MKELLESLQVIDTKNEVSKEIKTLINKIN